MTAPRTETRPPCPRTDALRELLRSRALRPEAAARVHVTTPPARSCYLQLTRVAGPREAVLDYAAWLLAPENAPPDNSHTHPDLEAVEHEEGDELTLLLSRPLYDGG
jgi:hypothetical protein